MCAEAIESLAVLIVCKVESFKCPRSIREVNSRFGFNDAGERTQYIQIDWPVINEYMQSKPNGTDPAYRGKELERLKNNKTIINPL